MRAALRAVGRERRCASQIEVGGGDEHGWAERDEATLRVEGRERRCASRERVGVGDERGCAARDESDAARRRLRLMLGTSAAAPRGRR